jgi:hypothetical protein
MAQIFISYRRHDSAYLAATLSDKLQERFGPNSVFFDIDNIPLGVDFREYIGNAVGQCDVLLVIIGNEWTGPADSQGNRRIDDPADYVRIEIESALKRNIPVIPILVAEATMPAAADLPPSLQSISFRNAAEIRAGRDLRQHIEQLIRGLEPIMKTASPAVPATPKEEPRLPQTKTEALERVKLAKDPEQQQPAEDAKQEGSKAQVDAVGSLEKSKKAEAPQKGETSAELLAEIEQVLDGCTDSHLFLGPAMPSKLANALSQYPLDSTPKDVLVFFDNTVFGGGKSSLILTPEAVYWFNNISGANGRISYVDIETVRFTASTGFFDANKILINQKEIEFYAGTTQVAAALANLIRHLVAQRK